MNRETMAVVGFGDLGRRVCAQLPAKRWRCAGLRRRAEEVPPGVRGVAVDLRHAPSLRVLGRLRPDALLIALTPAERSVEGYRAGFTAAMEAIVAGLDGHEPRQTFFVSSTRVYAGSAGAWIDEDAALNDSDPFAGAILDAERILLHALPRALVLRAAGLYGQGPGPLLKRVASGRLTPVQPPAYGNRIHRDDVAGFIVHCLSNGLDAAPCAQIVNLVDDAPVALQEVEAWLCEQLRLDYAPPAEPLAPPSSPGRDVASTAGNKRIRNSRLHASGYSLSHPDYRSGYADVLRQWMAHSEREDGLDLH